MTIQALPDTTKNYIVSTTEMSDREFGGEKAFLCKIRVNADQVPGADELSLPKGEQ